VRVIVVTNAASMRSLRGDEGKNERDEGGDDDTTAQA